MMGFDDQTLHDSAGQCANALLEHVPSAILGIDGQGTIFLANRAARTLFGYGSDEIRGVHVGVLMPDCLARMRSTDGGARQLRGVRRDGTAMTLEVAVNRHGQGGAAVILVSMHDVRKHLKMERMLRQREASLAHAQRLARIGSWERVVATGEYFWSDETCRIFGQAPGSRPLSHDEVTALVHPEDRARKLRSEDEAGSGMSDYDVVFRIVLPGGVMKVIHSRAVAAFGHDGQPLRFRGTVQDITEKTWSDEQLRQREEEYRALVENLPDVVLRFDRELRCVYVNPAIARACGLRQMIAAGRVLDGGTPAHAAWIEAMNKALWAGDTGSFEVSIWECGAWFHYQVQVAPEYRQGGKVATVLAVARDISAIRHSERVLRESEQRLSGIAANTPGMMFQWMAPAAGRPRFTYVSEGVVQLFGETPAAVLADPQLLARHFSEDEVARFRTSMAQSAERLDTLNWEGRGRGGDGREIWINCRATARRKDGDMIWEGVVLNITDSKRNECQLTESRRLLRELSAHREKMREEERKKVAREVHDELGQALTALRLEVAMLRLHQRPHTEALLARIQSIKDTVDRTIGIVRDLTTTLRPAALDLGLNAALEWQVEEFARRSGIACTLHAGATEAGLDDERATALFRIVQESLTNVLKHAQARTVEVALDVERDEIRLQVSDDGLGFEVETQPMHGKFGLVGMRERALMMGGSLDIRSQPGEGTRIQVRLPRQDGPPGSDQGQRR